jgi:hypothetical protein
MKIRGYSERGVMNALFYEMASSADPGETLHGLLSQVAFPFSQSRPLRGEEADVLIEQSFSDFGDPDALILMRAPEGRTCSVFIEAKIKTFRASDWHIAKEFAKFRSGLSQQKASSSDLFRQLYYKQRLVDGLRQGGVLLLKQGLKFPGWSSKRLCKIGKNEVVLKAAGQLENHCKEVFYVAVVPDVESRVAEFLPTLKAIPHETLAGSWDVSTYGFLTWSQARGFCEQHHLTHTLDVLDYNKGQIYRRVLERE